MRKFHITKVTDMWSTDKLMKKASDLMNKLEESGYEVFDISYGKAVGGASTFFITYFDKLEAPQVH